MKNQATTIVDELSSVWPSTASGARDLRCAQPLIAQETRKGVGLAPHICLSSGRVVAVLIMLVPVVPWGLRDAVLTTGAIYLMLTASTWLNRMRFAALDLLVLQCLMLTGAVIALALRGHDLSMRFDHDPRCAGSPA